MSRREPDWIDLICNDWAREKRKYLGMLLPHTMKAKERIGALKCNLGRMIVEGPAASQSTASRGYPEVFIGDAIIVNQIWHGMPQGIKKILMWSHYVLHEIPVTDLATAMHLDKESYYQTFVAVKNDLDAELKRAGIKEKSDIL